MSRGKLANSISNYVMSVHILILIPKCYLLIESLQIFLSKSSSYQDFLFLSWTKFLFQSICWILNCYHNVMVLRKDDSNLKLRYTFKFNSCLRTLCPSPTVFTFDKALFVSTNYISFTKNWMICAYTSYASIYIYITQVCLHVYNGQRTTKKIHVWRHLALIYPRNKIFWLVKSEKRKQK